MSFTLISSYITAGAVGVGLTLCLIHSILRAPPELFLDNSNDSAIHHNSATNISGLATSMYGSSGFQAAFNKLWDHGSSTVALHATKV